MKRIVLLILLFILANSVFSQTLDNNTIVIIVQAKQMKDGADRGIFRMTSSHKNEKLKYPSTHFTFRNYHEERLNIIFGHYNYYLDKLSQIRTVDPDLDQMDIQKWTRDYVNQNFRVIVAEDVPTESFVKNQLEETYQKYGNKIYIMDINTAPDSQGRYDCYRVKRLNYM